MTKLVISESKNRQYEELVSLCPNVFNDLQETMIIERSPMIDSLKRFFKKLVVNIDPFVQGVINTQYSLMASSDDVEENVKDLRK